MKKSLFIAIITLSLAFPTLALALDVDPVEEIEASIASDKEQSTTTSDTADSDTLTDEFVKTEVDEQDSNDGMPPVLPPPHFMRYKKPQPEMLLKDKDEGFYFTPMPIIAWDPDTEFNIGAAIQFFNNGKKDSPFFRYTPYRWTVATQALVSTGGVFQVLSYFDMPYVADTPWRVRGVVDVFRNPFKNYFGIANDGQQLTFPGTGQVFGSYDAYSNALKVQSGGTTNDRYDQYGYSHVLFRGTAEYDLVGGYIRPLFGIQISRTWIDDYTGDTISGATQNQTHLRADCLSGRAIGCNGGWDNLIKLGISFDTRDFEPNPTQGIFTELSTELSPKFLGSSGYYGRLNTDIRAYAPLLHWRNQNVVLAGRFYYGWQFGDVPFYELNTLSFTDLNTTGLGGFSSIRGYRLDRFIGPVQMLANMEIRYSFYDFTVWRQNIRLGIKPFLDVGRVFEDNSSITFRDWKLGGGGGLMLAWNLSTVISFDMAWSGEGSAFYMEAGLQF